MSLPVVAHLQSLSGESLSRHHALIAAIFTAVLVCVFSILYDFFLVFLAKPEHFLPPKGVFDRFITPKLNVPLIEVGEDGDYRKALAQGSKLYPDTLFKISHCPSEIVILPWKWMSVIQKGSDSDMSFQQGTYDMMVGDHTGIASHELAMTKIIRRDLGKILEKAYDVIDDEVIHALASQIGPCEDWTEIVLLPKIVQVIIMVSQRAFVGKPLCRDPKWLKVISSCTSGAFGSLKTLWATNWLTLPFVAWRHPGLLEVRKHRAETKKMLAPILEQRLKDLNDPSFKPPLDLMQLIIDGEKDGRGRNLGYQVDAQIGTGRAALFATGMTVFHLLYDLCVHSECIEPLRQEIVELGDVPLSKANLAKLRKMDSFIRECQRWTKFMLIGTIRKVLKPLTMPDGTVVPVGAIIAVDTQNAIFGNSTLENPYVFDGFRYEKLRDLPGNSLKSQAVTPAPDHIPFGYGPQACPGRFFGIHEAKVALVRVLQTYDLKLKDDEPVIDPFAKTVGILSTASPGTKFLFKARK